MTANRRIALNVLATNCRSLFAIVCSFFTARWSLMALGQEGYGLLGLIAGLIVFVSFFNKLLGKAIARFYACAIGEADITGSDGLEECRKWFNTAVFIHTIIPLLLMLIGYPLGLYVVKNVLQIPYEYTNDAICLLRFTCLSTFVGMVTVPQNAMYAAKQYIAELTVYSFATTILNVILLYWMASHEGKWLLWLAGAYCLEQVAVPLIISVRAHCVFKECRLVPRYLFDWRRIKEVLAFAGWQAVGMFANISKTQGEAILVNRFFGTRMNASMTVASSLSGRCLTFSNEVQAAFQPAIATAYGARDLERMKSLAYKCDKFCSLLILFFAVPICLEIELLLKLWLKNPPEATSLLCYAVILLQVIDKASVGEEEAIQATGRQKLLKIVNAVSLLLILPVVWICFRLQLGVVSIVNANLAFGMIFAFARVLIAKCEVGFSIRQWVREVLLPLIGVAAVGMLMAAPSRLFLPATYWRIVGTGACAAIPMAFMTWVFILRPGEREVVLKTLARKAPFLRRLTRE